MVHQEDYKRQEITTVQQVNQTRTGVRQVMVPQVVRNSLVIEY